MGSLKKRNWKEWITLRDFHSSDTQMREAGFKHEVTMDLLKTNNKWELKPIEKEVKFLLPNK